MTALIPFAELARRVEHRRIECHDPSHGHKSPVHHMFALPYRGHKVSVTISDGEYSIRIDNNPRTTRYGMSQAQAFAYVEAQCR